MGYVTYLTNMQNIPCFISLQMTIFICYKNIYNQLPPILTSITIKRNSYYIMPFYVVIVITLTLVVAICMRHSMYWYEAGGKEEEEMSSSRSTWMNEVQLLIGFPISQQHHQHYKPWWGGDKKWCACFQSKLWAIK